MGKNKKDGQSKEIKTFMNDKLPDLIKKRFILWCDPMGKSYFLNIFVPGRKNIVMSGAFWSLDSLKNITSYNIAKRMEINTDVKELEIPEALKPDIGMICRQLNKEKIK